MKILDVDYFVKGHHTAETYAAAHEVCKAMIFDNLNEDFKDPDAANSRLMVEFAVYVNEALCNLGMYNAMEYANREIGTALIQDFQFCISKVDPEIKYFEDRRHQGESSAVL